MFAGYRIIVHRFTEQWRFPRSRKNRIRNKWKKRARNWRLKPNQCFEMPDEVLVCSPDVAARLEKEFKEL